jgi:hypothetical protein
MGQKRNPSSFYDRPERIQHEMGLVDFGAASDITHLIQVPKNKFGGTGKRGKVAYVMISQVSEDFVGSTNDASVEVGDGTDANKYFDTGAVLDEGVDVADLTCLLLQNDDSDGGAGEDVEDIEGGRSTVTVTYRVSNGSETGQAHVTVVIDWY